MTTAGAPVGGVGSSRQVRILATTQLAASLLSFMFVFLPAAGDTMKPEHQVTLGVLWLLVATFTAVGQRRLPSWFIDVSLIASGLLLALSVLYTPRGQVQILDGVGLIGFGAFAAYQLTVRRLAVFLAVTSAAYLVAVGINPVLPEPFVAWLVIVIFILNTIHVHYLVSRLQGAAVTDPLTGALNRKGLFERAPGMRAVSTRSGNLTTVAVIDLDRFKAFNDAYGHAAGDRLLADLVTAWSAELRPSDLIARIGGDEFVLVLPNCDAAQAAATLDRLRGVSGSGWTSGTVLWESGVDILTAIDEADKVMYESKRSRASDARP